MTNTGVRAGFGSDDWTAEAKWTADARTTRTQAGGTQMNIGAATDR